MTSARQLRDGCQESNLSGWRAGYQMMKQTMPPPFLDWLKAFGADVGKGRCLSVDVLADGRARVTTDYPSLNAALRVRQHEDALLAICSEDAAAQEAGL
jgi:hypothetical protein